MKELWDALKALEKKLRHLEQNEGAGGVVVQTAHYQRSDAPTTPTVLPFDDTIPQNTEGGEFLTVAITPKNANNKLLVEVLAFGEVSVAAWVTTALFKDSVAGALAATSSYQGIATGGALCVLRYEMSAGGISVITFKARIGMQTAGTFALNALSAGTRVFGGVAASSIRVTEYAG